MALKDQEAIDRIMAEITRSIKRPNWKPQTSEQVKARADRLATMKTQVRLTGGQVREEYR